MRVVNKELGHGCDGKYAAMWLNVIERERKGAPRRYARYTSHAILAPNAPPSRIMHHGLCSLC